MLNVGVIGATGYTGEEIVKVLVRHPKVMIKSLSAIVEKPTKYSEIFPYFVGRLDLICKTLDIDEVKSTCKLVFLALPHTVSMEVAPKLLGAGIKVIDLSADYRLPVDLYKKWYGKKHADEGNLAKAVYGLPELYRDNIKKARLIANPGCYPTAVILAAAPVIKGVVSGGVITAAAMSGVTGAGRGKLNGFGKNAKAYKLSGHQHTPEMVKILSEVAGKEINILFVPHLIPRERGISATLFVPLDKNFGLNENTVLEQYKKFYRDEPFVRVCDIGEVPEIENVANTNYCDIGFALADGFLKVVSCIDNLLKGAGGQAVQNMNIMCGFNEEEGLI